MITGKLRSPEVLIQELKPYLRDYLEKIGTNFVNGKFQCPNRADHTNEDETPSASFVPDAPDESIWKCFACGLSGDIFKAAVLLEGKPASGAGFIEENVLYLAKLFEVPYELEELSEQEKLRREMFRAINWVTEIAHKSLWKSSALAYVRARGWSDAR